MNTIKTENTLDHHINLQPVALSDCKEIHRLYTAPETHQFDTSKIPTNLLVTQVTIEEWMIAKDRGKEYVYVIRSETQHHTIGLVGIRLGTPKFKIAVIWYTIFPEFWGNGYATAAVQKILHFGFEELYLHRIEAHCAITNIGSYRVLEKVGMKREGQKRKVYPLNTGWCDSFEYAILHEEWNN